MEGTVRTLAAVAEVRDPYTAGHRRRVTSPAVEIGKVMGLSEDRLRGLRGLRVGASIHDVGKISVPAEILSKSGPLSAAEFALIKGHAEAGARILAGVEFPWPLADMMRRNKQ